MAIVEICDICHEKQPDERFKVKMSRKGYYQSTNHGIHWTNLWQPYKQISICEDCAEKLLNIKSSKTYMNEIINSLQKQKITTQS